MKKLKFKKIYVLCPIGVKTGGPELLHQLVYQLNNIFGEDSAVIAYFGNIKKQEPVSEYNKYIASKWIETKDIKDERENLIIFPETALSQFNDYKYIHKYIWWLSVDNFLLTSSIKSSAHSVGWMHTIARWLKGNIRNYSKEIQAADAHLCQSYYSEKFLENMGISKNKIKWLSDYINDLYVQDSDEAMKQKKENIVLFNPKKGFKFTKKIISMSKSENWKWIPLIGLKNTEVKKLLSSSKVYIDFGNHPGKDRFPREAAILGCCIITGQRGAAKYQQDIPIDNKYKFSDKVEEIPDIIKIIRKCMDDYSNESLNFEEYREIIKKEKNTFKNSVNKIFNEE
ncbi:hypothetical protein [Lactobacillus crispatus]|uniref:Glycosyltransferase family 1 protein n=1 Tax=Lactobacillus crispatus (strain ST1) TaxID=748671 RepID=D5GZJ1_LACCS|nr:hypothetical protein [Lactobacillus crispatus]CBL51200.1 conserved hypothetical protein [Lactobacillus crispatus ST1]